MPATVIDVVNTAGEDLANTMIRSTAFARALDQVEQRARQAVVAETKTNAYTLLTLSVAGGAIGGFLFRGTAGVLAAVGLGWWAVNKLSQGSGAPPPPPQAR